MSCPPPAHETRAVPLGAPPLFADTLKWAVPGPVVEFPVVSVAKADAVPAETVQLQAVVVVTVTSKPPALSDSDAVVGDTA